MFHLNNTFQRRVKEVDFQEKIMQVKQSVTKLSGGRLDFREPKTNSSIRPINIDDDIVNILKQRKQQ